MENSSFDIVSTLNTCMVLDNPNTKELTSVGAVVDGPELNAGPNVAVAFIKDCLGGDSRDSFTYGAILPLQGSEHCIREDEQETKDTTHHRDSFNLSCIEDSDNLPCSWGPLRPSLCQQFRNPKVVLVFLCCASAIQGMVVNGFISVVISSIEKRFVLSSTETGFVASAYDIASVLMLIPVSYFGGMGCKPRWLGLGLMCVGFGSYLFALPHFTTGIYQYETTQDYHLCIPSFIANVSTSSSRCTSQNTKSKSLSNYKYMLIIAQLLHGAGAAPLYTLGITYMDENLKANLSPMYMGIFYSMAIIGPAAGYVLGGELLSLYCDIGAVDLSKLDITPDHPKWVGAWWLGFILSGSCALLISVPIFGFPKYLPGTAKLRSLRVSEAYKGAEQAVHTGGMGKNLQHAITSIRVLFTNPTFMCLNLAGASEGFLISGFTVFTPKFIESQFSISAGWAAQLVGLATIPAGGGGTFFGGYIVKKFDFNMLGILRMCLLSSVTALVLTLGFLVRCDNVGFAGVNVDYAMQNVTILDRANINLSSDCNVHCQCGPEIFDPVCGKNRIMYFSPCYAGCKNMSHMDNKKEYNECECISSSSDGHKVNGSNAKDGKCGSGCDFVALFLLLFSTVILVTFMTSMPALTATLRCVPENQRSFALGIQWILVRCLGTIPAPILFGSLIDKTCQLWQEPCSEDLQKMCSFYDNRTMGSYLLALVIMGKSLSVTFFILAWYLYRPPPSKKLIIKPKKVISPSSSLHILKKKKGSQEELD